MAKGPQISTLVQLLAGLKCRYNHRFRRLLLFLHRIKAEVFSLPSVRKVGI